MTESGRLGQDPPHAAARGLQLQLLDDTHGVRLALRDSSRCPSRSRVTLFRLSLRNERPGSAPYDAMIGTYGPGGRKRRYP